MSVKEQAGRVGAYLLAYSIWILSSLVGVGVALLLRGALSTTYVFLRLPPSAHHFVDYALLFIIGSVLIVWLIGAESYFRDGVDRGDLRRRIVRVLGIEAIAAAILFAVPQALTWLMSR